MRLMGKRILIEQHMSAKMTEGGIVVPETSQHALPRGKVLHVGPAVGWHDSATQMINHPRVGDTVLFNEMGHLIVEVGGQKLVLVEEEDIHMILEEGE